MSERNMHTTEPPTRGHAHGTNGVADAAAPGHADTAASTAKPDGGPRWRIALGWFVGLFGGLTVFSGGAVLFVGGPVSALAGSFVPFVVWANFLAGFAYIAAAVGLVRWRPWALPVSMAIAGLTVLVFAAFGIHVLSGGDFEIRTVGALALRCAVWMGIALALYKKGFAK